MLLRPSPQEPFEPTSNVIVGLVLVALMIVMHYMTWQYANKLDVDTSLMEYFYYVIDLVYNVFITN